MVYKLPKKVFGIIMSTLILTTSFCTPSFATAQLTSKDNQEVVNQTKTNDFLEISDLKTEQTYNIDADNKTATVEYTLSKSSNIVVQVYNEENWICDLVVFEQQIAGTHKATWNYSGAKKGNYKFVVFSLDNNQTVIQTSEFALTASPLIISNVKTESVYQLDADNKTAAVEYTLSKSSNIVVQVYNEEKWICDLVLFEQQIAGTHKATWNYSGAKKGNYKFVVFSLDNNQTVIQTSEFALTASPLIISNVKTESVYQLDADNKTATVEYTLSKSSNIVVQVYNEEKWICDLVLFKQQIAGTHKATWNYSGAKKGNYKFVVFSLDNNQTVIQNKSFTLNRIELEITNVTCSPTTVYTQSLNGQVSIKYSLNRTAKIYLELYKNNELFSKIELGEKSLGTHTDTISTSSLAKGNYKIAVCGTIADTTTTSQQVPFSIDLHNINFSNLSMDANTIYTKTNGKATLSFNLSKATKITAQVWNDKNEWITDLAIDQDFKSGNNSVSWSVNDKPGKYTILIYTKISNDTLISTGPQFNVADIGKVLYGIDVSHHNGTIDWAKVAQSGVEYSMIRTGFGKNDHQRDEKFVQNYAGATANGLLVGAYHYSYAMSVEDALKEADLCLDILNGRRMDLPVAFDLEDPTQAAISPAIQTAMVNAFCRKIASAGYTPMLYGSTSWLQNNLNLRDVDSNILLWEANWSGAPKLYGQTIHMWQKSGDGAQSEHITIPGITSKTVDTNYFYSEGRTIERPQSGNGNAICTVGTSGLRIRSLPSTDGKVLGLIPSGARLTVTGSATSGFYPITYDGISGYASVEYIKYPL